VATVADPTTISFADATQRVQVVTITQAGTLVRIGDQEVVVAAAGVLTGGEANRHVSVSGALDLALEAWGDAAGAPPPSPSAAADATGTVSGVAVNGLAAFHHGGRAASGVELKRLVTILFEDGPLAVALEALRPRGAAGHGDERLSATVFHRDPPGAVAVHRPRLSTTYDEEGLITHVGVELWETEDSDRPLRIGGETLAHADLVAADGSARTQIAFMAWHHDGQEGLGSYCITRPG
jgi:hypothetical protein